MTITTKSQRLADILAGQSAPTIGVLTTTAMWDEYAASVLPAILDEAERVHRATSGSGGCANNACDADDHAPSWHERFRATLAEALS